jgi:hypothetical protein
MLLALVALVALALVPQTAAAAVSVARAELSGGQLRVEGRGAQAGALVRVTSDLSSASRSADSSGGFRVEASSFRSSTCRVTVSDPVSSTTASLSGCTAASPPASGFAIDDRPLPDGNVGTDYNNFVTAQGGDGAPYRWSIVAGDLPDGLALRDFAPSSGIITGRPTTVQTATFTVQAQDQAGNTARRQFTIRINPPRPLVPTNAGPLAPGTVGEPYAIGVFADGGTTPYTWTLVGGALPPGLGLQASPGRITGTPTAAGTFGFTLRVDDAGGQSATASYSITVSAPPPPPSPPGAPALESPADGASVTTPFTIGWQPVDDPDGIRFYNWQLSASSAFTSSAALGTVAGTSTSATVNGNLAPGTYFWRVQAVDGQNTAGAYSAARSVTITGTTNPPTLAGISLNPANVTGGGSTSATVSITLPAPAGGVTVTLSSGEPGVAAVPGSVTVPAGQTTVTFTIPTQPVTSSHTVVITASLNGENRFAFLGVSTGATSPPAADGVAIQRAEYDRSRRTLAVEATSTSSTATLRVFNTATGAQIGTLGNAGGGRYRATFTNVRTNPGTITVRSTKGGEATRTVTVR